MSPLILKRAPIGPHQEEYEVLEDGVVVGRIFLLPIGWMWTLAYGRHKDPTPTHGYESSREAAMAAFAKSWWQET